MSHLTTPYTPTDLKAAEQRIVDSRLENILPTLFNLEPTDCGKLAVINKAKEYHLYPLAFALGECLSNKRDYEH